MLSGMGLPLGVLRRVQTLARRLEAVRNSDSDALTTPQMEAVRNSDSDAPTPPQMETVRNSGSGAPTPPWLKTVLISGTIEPEVREELLEAGFCALVAATHVGITRFKALSPYFTKRRLQLCVDLALHLARSVERN